MSLLITPETVLWFVAMASSLFVFCETQAWRGLTRMFPEGHRRWHSWARFVALVAYTALIAHMPRIME